MQLNPRSLGRPEIDVRTRRGVVILLAALGFVGGLWYGLLDPGISDTFVVVRGAVVDPHGKPAPGVEVWLSARTSVHTAQARSLENGCFVAVAHDPSTAYLLSVQFSPTVSRSASAAIGPGDHLEVLVVVDQPALSVVARDLKPEERSAYPACFER